NGRRALHRDLAGGLRGRLHGHGRLLRDDLLPERPRPGPPLNLGRRQSALSLKEGGGWPAKRPERRGSDAWRNTFRRNAKRISTRRRQEPIFGAVGSRRGRALTLARALDNVQASRGNARFAETPRSSPRWALVEG